MTKRACWFHHTGGTGRGCQTALENPGGGRRRLGPVCITRGLPEPSKVAVIPVLASVPSPL